MEDRPLEDKQLLQRFVRDNSQEAFAALTARYLNLVYAVCRREMGDSDAAEDVTQAVFLILARKAPGLGRNVVLSGWLFQTARFAAKNARLTAQRRAAYEQKAAEALMEQQTETEDEQWAEIEPLLNQSLAALKAGERECVLLRFFQGASFAEVGASLGLSEDAARKRVTRSLEKMRRFFSKNGIIVPALALPALLTAHAAKAAPVDCQASIANLTHSVRAGHAPAALTGSHAYQFSEGTLKAMKLAQCKLAAGIAAVLLVGSAYTVTRGIAHPASKAVSVSQQTADKGLTPAQVAERCRSAYKKLHSYEVTATVDSSSLTSTDLKPFRTHTSATILFVRPAKIHVEGKDITGDAFAYISDGIGTEARFGGDRRWKTEKDPETAIGSATGVAANAATTIPALLLGTKWGDPLRADAVSSNPKMRKETVEGRLYYVLTMHAPLSAVTQSLWIDEKTFLLRRAVEDYEVEEHTVTIAGKTTNFPTMKSHDEQNLTNERLNLPIPDSTFTLPPVQ